MRRRQLRHLSIQLNSCGHFFNATPSRASFRCLHIAILPFLGERETSSTNMTTTAMSGDAPTPTPPMPSPEYLGETMQGQIIYIMWTVTVISLAFVIGRCYTRLVIRSIFGADDWLMCFSMVRQMNPRATALIVNERVLLPLSGILLTDWGFARCASQYILRCFMLLLMLDWEDTLSM